MEIEVTAKVDITSEIVYMSLTEQEELARECLECLSRTALTDILNEYVSYIDDKVMINELEQIGYKVTEEE